MLCSNDENKERIYMYFLSQDIYLSCNDKGRSGMKSAERARSIYSEEQEKNRVSGTKPSDSRSEYVIKNKKKLCFRKVA